MSRITRVSGIFSLGLALAPFAVACGLRSSSLLSETPDGGTAATCVAGGRISCTCSSGEIGTETCASNGDGYGACSCEPTPLPPGTGTGGTSPPPTEVDAGSPSSTTPPAPPTGGTPPTSTVSAFAVHHVHLGDEPDSSGNPGWYQYGYNLDGKDTTAVSTDVCALAANANGKNQTDGPGGIDNSFGENFIPLLTAVTANPSQAANTAIASGSYSWIFSFQGLSGSPTQSSTGLAGGYFLGAPFGEAPNGSTATPTFTASDDWPVDRAMVTSSILASGELAQPVTSTYPFAGAYIVGGELVSGAPAAVELVIAVSGQPLHLKIQHAIVTFNLPGATQATGGIVAGVIATEDLVGAVQAIAGNISSSLCTGNTFDQIATSIRQAADIMVDGTNNPGTPCNAISIGVGFDADEIQPPTFAGTVPAASDLCDGG